MPQVLNMSTGQSELEQNGDAKKPPMFLHARSSQAFIIATVALSVFVDVFLYAVIVPVIPFALHERAGVAQADRQYYVSVLLAAYGGALLVASPISGMVSDKLRSRLWPFLSGLILLAGATICLCLGQSVKLLIVGRILQGASAAIVWTIGLALLVDTIGRRRVGWAMGFVSSAMSLGLLLAPVLGGIVFSQSGYYSVYAMCFGLIGVNLVMRVLVIEKKTKRFWLGEDASRSNSSGPTPGRNTPRTPRSGRATPRPEETADYDNDGASAPGGPRSTVEVLAARANRGESNRTCRLNFRLPPVLTLLSSRRILTALGAALIQAIILTAFDSTIPLYVRQIWGWESLNAGLLFIPLVLPTFTAPIFGWIADKFGPRYLTTAGFVLTCPFIIALRAITDNTINQKVGMCFLLFFIGVVYSMAFAPVMAEITYAVSSKEQATANRPAVYFGKHGAYGQAYGLFNLFFAGGCLIGPIWGGMIREAAGWGTMTLALGLLSLVTAIPVFVWSGGSFFDKSKRKWQREVPNPPRTFQAVDLETNNSDEPTEVFPISDADNGDQHQRKAPGEGGQEFDLKEIVFVPSTPNTDNTDNTNNTDRSLRD